MIDTNNTCAKEDYVYLDEHLTRRHSNMSTKCGIMEVFNTHYPQQYFVPCNETLTTSVICKLYQPIFSANSSFHNSILHANIFCTTEKILFSKKCISLKMTALQYKMSTNADTSLLGHLMMCVSLVSEEPVYFHARGKKIVTFDQLKKNIEVVSDLSANRVEKAFQILDSLPLNKTFVLEQYRNQLVKCSTGEHVSRLELFNRKQEYCSGDEFKDVSCFVRGKKHTGIHCLTNCKLPNCECNDLFYQSTQGSCEPFKGEYIPVPNKAVNIDTNEEIITDCTEDEFNSIENDKATPTFTGSCEHPHKIQCTYGCKRCIAVGKVCIYELDFKGTLMHCPSGNHIKNCQLMECNNMFKCARQYCIPYRYIIVHILLHKSKRK